MMDPQTCAAIGKLLPYYAANQLGPVERAAVERHIATCRDCRSELREWLTLGVWLAQAEVDIPPDASDVRGLAAIHARLRQIPTSPAAAYDLDGSEMSALPIIADQECPPYPTGEQEAGPSPILHERRPLPPASEVVSSRPPYQPHLSRRRVPAAMAWTSVAMFVALAAGLFYLIAPQLRTYQNTNNSTATATTQPTATPKALSGSWHTAPNAPDGIWEFSKTAPRIGYFCTSGRGALVLAPSSQWLYRTDDGGITWRPVGGITPPGGFTDCSVIVDSNDANDVFVQLMCQCSPGNMPPMNQMLWRSRDGGAIWKRLAMPQMPFGWANIVVVGSRIVGLGTDDKLLNTPPPAEVVCSTDPRSRDLHQVNDLYASDDGGMTWKQMGQPLIAQGLSIMPGGLTGFDMFGAWIGRPSPDLASVGTTLFVSTYCDTRKSIDVDPPQNYWKSSDGGGTWTKLPTPDSDLFFTPSATGGAYGVAVNPGVNSNWTTPPVLLFSRDSGANWETLPSLGSIPLPPHFRPSAPNCVACNTRYGTPLTIALPDGTVLAVLTVDDVINNTYTYISNMYTIDPQSPHPAWHLFAPMSTGSPSVAIMDSWPLAATKQGLVLWAIGVYRVNGKPVAQRVYLTPLP